MKCLLHPNVTQKLTEMPGQVTFDLGKLISNIEARNLDQLVNDAKENGFSEFDEGLIFLKKGSAGLFGIIDKDKGDDIFLVIDVADLSTALSGSSPQSDGDGHHNAEKLFSSWQVDPSRNWQIDPRRNWQIDPSRNWQIDPSRNWQVDPHRNWQIDPHRNWQIDPNKNYSVDPRRNYLIDPSRNTSVRGPFVYNKNFIKIGFLVRTKSKVFLWYNSQKEIMGFAVDNSGLSLPRSFPLFAWSKQRVGHFVLVDESNALWFDTYNNHVGYVVGI